MQRNVKLTFIPEIVQRVSGALQPVEVGEEGTVIVDIDGDMNEDDVIERIFENVKLESIHK